ncbi:hypothetical protein NEOLI_005224 [Neolecta irregularis DAH-3]|uniref:Uncharacterized protein n=1 Tax=Neolecta irregularis (strain DAH-3) TaxID=1198029 RepID=A0A1U7LTI6_NEOID|nr:hypothetical protein NEOLI_005224 [Neolecta irregularis DAH-3]|eukprot:OLL25977.1 hypothetical protein NEOLI_005224 [Neolecta irregularis DAH-3]
MSWLPEPRMPESQTFDIFAMRFLKIVLLYAGATQAVPMWNWIANSVVKSFATGSRSDMDYDSFGLDEPIANLDDKSGRKRVAFEDKGKLDEGSAKPGSSSSGAPPPPTTKYEDWESSNTKKNPVVVKVDPSGVDKPKIHKGKQVVKPQDDFMETLQARLKTPNLKRVAKEEKKKPVQEGLLGAIESFNLKTLKKAADRGEPGPPISKHVDDTAKKAITDRRFVMADEPSDDDEEENDTWLQ